MGFFATHTMTIRRSNPTNGQILTDSQGHLAQHLPVQLDPKNLDWQMEVQSVVPTDTYDCETIGWTQPVPQRSDYLIDEATGIAYSVRSTVFIGINSLQFQITKYGGDTP